MLHMRLYIPVVFLTTKNKWLLLLIVPHVPHRTGMCEKNFFRVPHASAKPKMREKNFFRVPACLKIKFAKIGMIFGKNFFEPLCNKHHSRPALGTTWLQANHSNKKFTKINYFLWYIHNSLQSLTIFHNTS